MTIALLWLGVAALAAGVTSRVVARLTVRAPLGTSNYRGLHLPTALGIGPTLGIVAGLALIAGVRALAGTTSDRMVETALVALTSLAAVAGFALLGLWDDLAGQGRGWRLHLASLRRGEPTGGAIKLAGGIAVALVVVSPFRTSVWWTIGDAAVVAMAANLFNLLDARPGRAGKVYVVAALPMIAVGGPAAPALMAGLGAVVAFLPFDLRERAMLGDTGANALGALIGVGIVLVGSDLARLIALLALTLLHLLADRPGLSVLIERVPPLRRADAAGRVPG